MACNMVRFERVLAEKQVGTFTFLNRCVFLSLDDYGCRSVVLLFEISKNEVSSVEKDVKKQQIIQTYLSWNSVVFSMSDLSEITATFGIDVLTSFHFFKCNLTCN